MPSLRVRQDRGHAVTAAIMWCLLGIASAPGRADDARWVAAPFRDGA